jgi:hypothetical protein
MGQLANYIIDHADVDWSDLLPYWAWLLPREVTVWIMNRFGDLFLVVEDGSVHMLDVGGGSLEKVGESRDEFAVQIDQGDNANQWLMIPLVDELVAAGVLLKPGECYGYRELPILGGDYTIDNTQVLPIPRHYQALGTIHERLKDIPDGTHVEFEID